MVRICQAQGFNHMLILCFSNHSRYPTAALYVSVADFHPLHGIMFMVHCKIKKKTVCRTIKQNKQTNKDIILNNRSGTHSISWKSSGIDPRLTWGRSNFTFGLQHQLQLRGSSLCFLVAGPVVLDLLGQLSQLWNLILCNQSHIYILLVYFSDETLSDKPWFGFFFFFNME